MTGGTAATLEVRHFRGHFRGEARRERGKNMESKWDFIALSLSQDFFVADQILQGSDQTSAWAFKAFARLKL